MEMGALTRGPPRPAPRAGALCYGRGRSASFALNAYNVKTSRVTSSIHGELEKVPVGVAAHCWLPAALSLLKTLFSAAAPCAHAAGLEGELIRMAVELEASKLAKVRGS